MRIRLFFVFLWLLFTGFYACDTGKIQPGITADSDGHSKKTFDHIFKVRPEPITRFYEAAGTIRPLTESVIEAQTSAKILKVLTTPGSRVTKGQLLIQLDARRLETRLRQAREGLSMAEKQAAQAQKAINEADARLNQARLSFQRSQKLFESAIISSQKREQEESVFLMAKAQLEKAQQAEQAVKAGVRQAKEVVKEAEIALGYANLRSPANGIVARRMADPGDLAVPGKPLLIIQTSGSLRLEAHVREGMIHRIHKGTLYQVRIEILEQTLDAAIEEILPYADPHTRTFLVKATLPSAKGVYPGMFGRLLIPLDPEPAILIPQAALVRIGQLEQVFVQNNNTWQRVYVKTGQRLGERIEILSGLSGTETLGY